MQKYLKKATYNDCDLLFNWANDKTVRENSFNSNKIKYEEHVNWFQNKLNSNTCDIFVFYYENIPTGKVIIDIENKEAKISYSIDANYRGCSLSIEMLKLLEINVELPINKFVGYVKYDNIKSQKVFERLGYQKVKCDNYIKYYKQLMRGFAFMNKMIKVSNKIVGSEQPVFIIAEISANHNGSFDNAVKLIKEAAKARVDAIKLQTYTADTITIDCNNKYFQIKQGTLWDGRTLYNLYKEAYTPWEWQPKLKKIAEEEGLIFFSSPFDKTAVDFLQDMNVPAYKVASFEITDIPLIEYMASKGKPMILSTGIATLSEIQEAADACKRVGNNQIALLKCTSSYPAPLEDMNLKTIPNLAETFNVVSGLSDHTLGISVPIAAVALGAKIIEKHFTLCRADGGPDAGFSLEPDELKAMVKSIREIEKALGTVTYDLTDKMKNSKAFSRSLFIVKNIKKGEVFTESNVKSIRPGYGMHTRYYNEIIGKTAKEDINKGTPMEWKLIDN